MAKKSEEEQKKKKEEKIENFPLTSGDKLKIKRKEEGKSTSEYKTQARYEELFDVTRELIKEGEVKNEKEASEALSKVTDYSKNYIRYKLLPEKAPEDIKKKLGLKEEKEETRVKPERKKRSPLEEFKESWKKYREGEIGKLDVIKSIPGKIPEKTGKLLEDKIEKIKREEAEEVSAEELLEKVEKETKVEFEIKSEKREEKKPEIRKIVKEEGTEEETEDSEGSESKEHEVKVTGAGAGGGGGGIEINSKTIKWILVFLFILIVVAWIASFF